LSVARLRSDGLIEDANELSSLKDLLFFSKKIIKQIKCSNTWDNFELLKKLRKNFGFWQARIYQTMQAIEKCDSKMQKYLLGCEKCFESLDFPQLDYKNKDEYAEKLQARHTIFDSYYHKSYTAIAVQNHRQEALEDINKEIKRSVTYFKTCAGKAIADCLPKDRLKVRSGNYHEYLVNLINYNALSFEFGECWRLLFSDIEKAIKDNNYNQNEKQQLIACQEELQREVYSYVVTVASSSEKFDAALGNLKKLVAEFDKIKHLIVV